MNYLLARKIAYAFSEYSPFSKFLGVFLPWSSIKKNAEIRFRGLGVETTNHCNANCIFCAYSYMTRPKGEMSMELFKKIVREYAEIGGGGLRFSPMGGDPLMDTKIMERIHFARCYDNMSEIFMYTNGISLDEVGPKDLLDSGIHSIRLSIPGHDREAYKRMAGVDEFDRVSTNVLELLAINNRKGRPVEIRLDIRADVAMSQVSKAKAIQRFRKLTNLIDYQIYYHNWGGVVPSGQVPVVMRKERIRRRKGVCFVFYHAPKVLWNGDFSACGYANIDGDRELILGNARDCHIVEMWHSEAMKELRIRFAEGNLPRLCRRCSHYRSSSFGVDLAAQREIKKRYQDFLASDYFCRMRPGS